MSKTVWIAGITAVVLTAAVCTGIICAVSAESSGRAAVSGGEGKAEMETEIQLAAADRETLQAGAPGEKAEGQAGKAGQTSGEGRNGSMGQTDGINQAGSAGQTSGAAQTGNTGLPEGISKAGAEQESATAQSASGSENQTEPPAEASRPQALIVDSDPQMYTYDQMTRDLQAMEAGYPDLVTLDSLTDTPDGRSLWHLVIGDSEKAGRHILVTASIHAREYMTTQLVMKQTSQFLGNIQNYPGITEGTTAFHVVPMINPDGVSISQMGLEGCLTEETRERVLEISRLDGAQDMNAYLRRWKSNSRGVDLNRNFDALWESYNDGLGRPSADHYKGTAPGSEPEAAALIALTERYPFARTVSYHTQGNVIYWYFGQTGELKEATRALANQVGALTGYPTDANYEKLDPAGYKDWAISKKGIPSLTIEVGTETSPVPPSQFQAVWRANIGVWDVLLQE